MAPSTTSKRSLRALEMLDKQISKRSSKLNDQSQNNMPWRIDNNNTSSNKKSPISNKPNLPPQNFNKIVLSPNATKAIDILNESPTPKRRKLIPKKNSTNNEHTSQQQQQQDNFLMDTEEESHMSGLSSSPIKKMVVFSDTIEIESSPTQRGMPGSPDKFTENLQRNGSIVVTSSPRRSPDNLKRPTKSILKNNYSLTKQANNNIDVSPNSNKVHTRPTIIKQQLQSNNKNNNILNNSNNNNNDNDSKLLRSLNSTITPFQLEFWTKGYIHSLSHPRNIEQFKNIIVGGLFNLQHNSEQYNKKSFEIFATFNNILCTPAGKKYGDLDEKKAIAIIENFMKISKICIPHWKTTHQTLLNSGETKDPFQTRLYVQIVKFFTIILSNFKIINWLNGNKTLIAEVKEVFQLSKDALTNSNSNKQMINSNLTFLKEEKFNNYYATETEIQGLINIIPNIKELKSKHYMTEKILFIKSLFNSYPDPMINNMNVWLFGEIFPRILVEDDIYSDTVLHTSNFLLSDVMLKLYDTDNEKTNELYTIFTQKPIKRVFSQKFLTRLDEVASSSQSLPCDLNINSETLETLLYSHISYLLKIEDDPKTNGKPKEVKKHKDAIHLWLTTTGMLFNTFTTIKKFITIQIDENKWLKLNKIAFEVNNPITKHLALKSWRILIYPICNNIHRFDQAEKSKCFQILKIPFEMAATVPLNPYILSGVSFCTSSLTYTFTGYLNNAPFSEYTLSNIFNTFWDNLLLPIYTKILSFETPQHQSKKLIFDMVKTLLGADISIGSNSPNKISNHKMNQSGKQKFIPLNAIITSGVSLNEIPSLSSNLQHIWFPNLRDFLFIIIKKHCGESDCLSLIFALIDSVSDALITNGIFVSLQELLSYYLEHCCRPPINPTDSFYSLTRTLFIKFSSLIFMEEDKNMVNYFKTFNKIMDKQNEFTLHLLKDVIKSTRDQQSELVIFYKFLQTDDDLCKNYTINWLSSTLLSPKMNYRDFSVLMKIIEITSKNSIIENFLSILPRMDDQYLNLIQDSCGSWLPDSLKHFITGCLSTNNQRLQKYALNLVKQLIPQRNEIFVEILPSLHAKKFTEFIHECCLENPVVLKNINAEDLEYLGIDRDDSSSMSAFLLENISRVPEEKLSFVLELLLKEKGLDALNSNSELFSSLLFEPSSKLPIEEKQRVILYLLESSYTENNWKAFNLIIEQSLSVSEVNFVEMFFSNHNTKIYDVLSHFPISLIVGVCSNGGRMDTLINQAIFQMFQHKDQDYAISLTRSFLTSEKYTDLGRFTNAVCLLLLNSSDDSPITQKSKKLKLCKDIILTFKKSKRQCLVDLLDSFVTKFPLTKSDYIVQLLKILPEVLPKGKWKPDISVNKVKVLSEIERLEHTNSETVQEATMNKSNILSGSSSEEQQQSNQSNKDNQHEVQVPATQKSDISSRDLASTQTINFYGPGSLAAGKIITSSNNISLGDDANPSKIQKDDEFKIPSQLPMTTSTQTEGSASNNQLSRSSDDDKLKKTDNINTNIIQKDVTKVIQTVGKRHTMQEPCSSFSALGNSGSHKSFGISDGSSTIDETERLSQLEKIKRKTTNHLESGIDIHNLFQSSLNHNGKNISTIRHIGEEPLSSPLSKQNHGKLQRHVSSLSSPIKRRRSSSDVIDIDSPFKRPNIVQHKSDNELNKVDNNDIVTSAVQLTIPVEEEPPTSNNQSHDKEIIIDNETSEIEDILVPEQELIEEAEVPRKKTINTHPEGENSNVSKHTENLVVQVTEKLNDKDMKNHTSSNFVEEVGKTTMTKDTSYQNEDISSSCHVNNQSEVDMDDRSSFEYETKEVTKTVTVLEQSPNIVNKISLNENEKDKNQMMPNCASVKQINLIQQIEEESKESNDEPKTENNEVKQKIRIPIFNSLKLAEKLTNQQKSTVSKIVPEELSGSGNVVSPPLPATAVAQPSVQIPTQADSPNVLSTHQNNLLLNPKVKEFDTNESIDITKQEIIEIEDNADESDLENAYMADTREQTDGDVDNTSRESTPSLKVHFPSRKTRKLVNRLHNFSTTELAAIPIAERRNLRVELLDFMMKLEYYNTDET